MLSQVTYTMTRRALILALLLVLSNVLVESDIAFASSYVPPEQVTVRMLRLQYPSGAKQLPETLCSTSNDTTFGCTAFDLDRYGTDARAYPYSANPIAVSIENDYLLDIIPQEVSVDAFHFTAIQAQAIAARSYAYYHINQGSVINNSTQFQAFIPFKFESLNPVIDSISDPSPCTVSDLGASRTRVCTAVAYRRYVSYGIYPNDDLPAATEFFGDIPNRTVTGGQLQPYELNVDDPISSHPDVIQDGHGRGMSQKGASRWAYGNRGFGGNLDAWSVSWDRPEQILTHYYTGVHLRNADSGKALLTPEYRWNPLRLNWGTPENRPPMMFHGYSYPISVQVQNTGTSDWICSYPDFSYTLYYRWNRIGHPAETGSSSASVCGQTKGDPSPLKSLTISNIPDWGTGSYQLNFDIYVSTYGGGFWFGDQWPPYRVSICVDGPCRRYMPYAVREPQ